MATPKTVTVTCAAVSDEKHNLEKEERDKKDHIDHERTENNVTFEYKPLADLYQEEFSEAVREYNAQQKRPERQKTVEGYLNELEENSRRFLKLDRDGKAEDKSVKSRYEMILEVGDMHDTGYKEAPEDAKLAEKVLTEYWQGFKERNPNMKVQQAVMHCDEAKPHLHLAFVPVADGGYKTGLKKRVSMSKALAQQGFPDKKGEIGFEKWIKAEREELAKVARKHGIDIVQKNDPKRDRMTKEEYKSFIRAMERETGRQLEQDMKKEPLKKLKKAEKGMFGYSKEDYERLYNEYIKLGDRCWKAERLLKETAAMDKTKLEAENKELSQGVDDLLAAVDEKEKALGKSRALTKQAAGAFKIAVGVLSESQAKYVSDTLQKAGYNEKLTKVAGERLKKCQQIKSHQQSQQGSLDLSEAKKKLEKTVGKVLKR